MFLSRFRNGVLIYGTHFQCIDPTGTSLSSGINDLDLLPKQKDFRTLVLTGAAGEFVVP